MAKRAKRRRVVTVKRPGQPGTIKLLKKYGASLRRVRYVHDYDTGERYKSIELIQQISKDVAAIKQVPPELWVGIELGENNKGLRKRVRAVGGRYDTHERLWYIRLKDYKAFDLDEERFKIKETLGEYRLD